MTNRINFWLCALIVLVPAFSAAQQATEVYIPIGDSPGVSGEKSIIGSIASVEHGEYRMTISTAGERKSVTMTPKTRYYIDKSYEKLRSEVGSYEDCEVGMRVEVYVNDAAEAIWVKVRSGE